MDKSGRRGRNARTERGIFFFWPGRASRMDYVAEAERVLSRGVPVLTRRERLRARFNTLVNMTVLGTCLFVVVTLVRNLLL